jgi:hypothetical protein
MVDLVERAVYRLGVLWPDFPDELLIARVEEIIERADKCPQLISWGLTC